VFGIFNLGLTEIIVLAGLGLLVLVVVLAVIFLASPGNPQDRRRDED
jgi:hypothetical protein